MILDRLSESLEKMNEVSKFNTFLNESYGYIDTSNSGKAGEKKTFSIGIDAYIETLKNIYDNIESFVGHENYNEDEWRDLGPRYFKNPVTYSLSSVQTKLLFTTLSKLVCWANGEDPSSIKDNLIDLKAVSIQKAIDELQIIANVYSSPKKTEEIVNGSEIVISEKDLRSFTLKSFQYLLNKQGDNILGKITEAEAKINDESYIAIKIKEYFGTGNLIATFEKEQNKTSLSSSDTQRFFEQNLGIGGYNYSYFTTQWGDVDGVGLNFNSFQKFVHDLTKGEFQVNRNEIGYSLIKIVTNKPKQVIFYGAPGTGKSHRIESIIGDIPESQKERVTFHPEYDYSSFIGGFRPHSEKNGENKYIVTYKFIPQVFTNIYVKAWRNPKLNYYLAIEEINRGNCAEIFGDIFQLLDRNSKYNITPSKDLLDYLNEELIGDGVKGIEEGKMKLPPNLHILASMNTSDQSLFPMDSAFKRRWAWEYIPINYDETDDQNNKNESYDFIVKIDDNQYFRWVEFISAVNDIIKRNSNLGSDKCIGNYFIKPEAKEISLEEFINKAIFYLWIDVFKDEEDSVFHLIEQGTTYEDFFPVKTKGKDLIIKLLSADALNVSTTLLKKETEKEE